MKPVSVTVDSISEGIAVLDTPHGPVRMPAALLPKGTKEGTRLLLSLQPDPEGEARAREDVRRLRKELGGDREPPDVTEL